MPDSSPVTLTPERDPTGHGASAIMSAQSTDRFSWRVLAVATWLTFSVALAVWWLIFGLNQVDRLSALAKEDTTGTLAPRLTGEIAKQHRMLVAEGATLVILLFGGGAALLYHVQVEIKRTRRLQKFFAAFTHDLKTSLSSLRLQAESLEEDLKDSGEGRVARRLVKDTVRLELQLENSLLLAAPSSETRLLLEPLRLGVLLQTARHQWPDLDFNIEGDATVIADSRALDSILKNLFQNAVVHGRASKMTIDIHRDGAWVTMRIGDDGRGFKGDLEKLGTMFERHATTSGSGLGLYLGMDLAERMQGVLRFVDSSNGFTVELVLPSGTVPHREESA